MWGVPPVGAPKGGEISPALKAAAETLMAGVKRDVPAILDHFKKADKVPGGDPGPSLPALVKEARDHYWVQLSQDGSWTDFDPSFADATPGQAHANGQEPFVALPDSQFHRITIRVRVEESSILVKGGEAGKPVSREILRLTTKAADLSGLDVLFTHQLENWKGPARDVKSALSTAIANTGRIKPVLLAGPAAVVAGESFYYQLPTGKGLGGVGGLLGGLGTRTPVPIATAESVEFEFVAPDGQKETVLREIFDRVGPARRAGAKALNAAEIRTQLAVKEDATSGVFSFFFTTGRFDMAHLQGAAAQAAANEASVKKDDKTINIRDPLRSIHISLVSISDGLLGRLGKKGDAVVCFYPDSPRLQIAEFSGRDRRFTLDLRRDRVRAVAPNSPPGTVFYARVLRGVVQGSLERAVAEHVTTEFVRNQKWGPVVSTSTLCERAKADGVGVVLFNGDRPLPQNAIPGDAHARVQRALAGGNWVIAPERAMALGGRERFAWWQVDPRSGETIAVTDDGLHGAPAVERPFTEVHIVGGSAAGVMAAFVYSNVGGLLLFEQSVEILATSVVGFITALQALGPVVVKQQAIIPAAESQPCASALAPL
jgi:hypothetical protein